MTAEEFDFRYGIHQSVVAESAIPELTEDDASSPTKSYKDFQDLRNRDGVETSRPIPVDRADSGFAAIAGGGASSTPGGKSAESLSNEKEATELALKLAATLTARLRAKLDPQKAGFELARLLVGAGFAGPAGMESVAEAFAERCGFTLAEVWGTVENGWHKVRSPVGDDSFDELARCAKGYADSMSLKAPVGPIISIAPDPGRAYFHVAVLAWLLQENTAGPDADFIFATTRLSKTFGWHRSTAADAVKILVDRGVIVCTDAKYSLPGGKARRYRFVGSVKTKRVKK